MKYDGGNSSGTNIFFKKKMTNFNYDIIARSKNGFLITQKYYF